jgi:HEAT repeat protein
MNKSFRRIALLACGATILAACGNRETKEALDKSSSLAQQQQYTDANDVLIAALQARETKIRNAAGNPADQTAADALTAKVQADSEILKMERAQIPIYLLMDHVDSANMASAVYTDVLLGDPTDTSVFNLLRSPDKILRKGAVGVLGLAADPKSKLFDQTVDALINATKDSDDDVRHAAVSALATIKDPRVVPPLIAALKDSAWSTRFEAASALGEKNDIRAVGPLFDAIGDSKKIVSDAAHDALVDLVVHHDADGKPDAVVKADDFAPRLNDPNEKISMTAAECMGLLGDTRAVPVLLKLANSTDGDIRLNAVKGLGEAGDKAALPTLRQGLKDPNLNMRGWSIIGLGRLKDEDSLIDLEHIATDDTQPTNIRQAAAAAVDQIKSSLPPDVQSAPDAVNAPDMPSQ